MSRSIFDSKIKKKILLTSELAPTHMNFLN